MLYSLCSVMKIEIELEGKELKRKLDLLSSFISGQSAKLTISQISRAIKRDTEDKNKRDNNE